MTVNGIIAEYNPFHSGHKYLMAESGHRTGADYTIVVMSGNYVQRGAPAIIDKHARTRMALSCGADLVLELPVAYALSSAETFAAGSVSLLDSLGVVTHLCFGSECGEIEPLRVIAEFLLRESEEYRSALKRSLKQGLPYPHARARALSECGPLGTDCREILSSPNNTLGVDYCKALLVRKSAIRPVTVKRAGLGYHEKMSDNPSSKVPVSALAIREALCSDADSSLYLAHMPEEAGKILTAYLAQNSPVRTESFSDILHYKLLLEREKGYEKYLDVSASLSNRIQNHLNRFAGYDAFCSLLKTKDMTYARISRCLLHILLGIEREHMEYGKILDCAPYARVLGFRRSAAPLLGAIKKHSATALITRLADAQKSLPTDADRLFKLDLFSDEIYNGIVARQSGSFPKNEFSTPLTIL